MRPRSSPDGPRVLVPLLGGRGRPGRDRRRRRRSRLCSRSPTSTTSSRATDARFPGRRFPADARFRAPSGLAVLAGRGLVLVIDRDNHRIRAFALESQPRRDGRGDRRRGSADGPLAQAVFDTPSGTRGDLGRRRRRERRGQRTAAPGRPRERPRRDDRRQRRRGVEAGPARSGPPRRGLEPSLRPGRERRCTSPSPNPRAAEARPRLALRRDRAARGSLACRGRRPSRSSADECTSPTGPASSLGSPPAFRGRAPPLEASDAVERILSPSPCRATRLYAVHVHGARARSRGRA